MTPELAHVLKHELAHSFITQLSGGRCPPWLHEGIAQFLEPKSLGSEGRQLALLFKAQQNIPLNALEGSFQSFSGAQAYVAYAESLAAVSYINDTYGMSDIQRILAASQPRHVHRSRPARDHPFRLRPVRVRPGQVPFR